MKITFKKEAPATGLTAEGYPDTQIKVDKLVVGFITAPSWQAKDSLWGIRLTVIKEKPEKDPCKWKWISLKRRFDSESEARIFLKERLMIIMDQAELKLHQFPKDEI